MFSYVIAHSQLPPRLAHLHHDDVGKASHLRELVCGETEGLQIANNAQRGAVRYGNTRQDASKLEGDGKAFPGTARQRKGLGRHTNARGLLRRT